MRFKHTNRKGFWLGFIDFFTAGLFFLVYMQRGLQDELDAILGRRTQRYYVAYLLGIPTLFLYTLVWMARIAEELRAKAIELGIEGKLTSFRHIPSATCSTGTCSGCCSAARRSPRIAFSTRSTRSSGNSTDAIRPSELREERPCNHERNVNKQREG